MASKAILITLDYSPLPFFFLDGLILMTARPLYVPQDGQAR
jgi:hypothetical protein